MSKTYQAIIFDFFDVIHDDPFHKWLNTYGLQNSGKIEEANNLVDSGHIGEQEFYQHLAAASGQAIHQVESVFGDTSYIDWELIAIINRLRKHYTIGLLSNASSEYLRPILEDNNIAHLFDEVVISAETRLIKPMPEAFRFILKKLTVEPDRTLFIDDNSKNVAAARRLGIDSIIYTGVPQLKAQLKEHGITLPQPSL